MINQTIMNLFWLKCENNAWCSLRDVDLSHSYYDNFVGIYIIWYWDNFGNPVTVKVGQGNLRERLTAHNTDPRIQTVCPSEFTRYMDRYIAVPARRRRSLPRQSVETESEFVIPER